MVQAPHHVKEDARGMGHTNFDALDANQAGPRVRVRGQGWGLGVCREFERDGCVRAMVRVRLSML